MTETELKCYYNPYKQKVAFHLLGWQDREEALYGEVVYKKVDHGDNDRPPSFCMNETNCQQLVDHLWKCGYRPTEGQGSAGSLLATQRHLNDMRTIAFNKLRITDDKI